MHNKYKNIDEFFKKNVQHLKIDKRLIDKLKHFRLTWSTKDSDYMDFLGSNLLGTHTIRFSIIDDEHLMYDVFKIRNYVDLQKEIFYVKDIEPNFKIASNIIYQTLMYVGHLIMIDKKLSSKDKEKGIREVCLIMQYKMFSSLYGWYFKYTTTEAIANTVYEKLSHKFLIKQLDSWQEVFEYRVKSCMDKKSPNYNRIKKYSTEDSLRLISDIQTKLREQVKQIYSVLMSVLDNNEIIEQESSTYVGGENNEEQIKDIDGGIGTYITRMKNIALSPTDFIDSEILSIVDNLFNNINKDILYDYLKAMSDDEFVDTKEHMKYIEDIIIYSFTYLQRNGINIEHRENIPKAVIMIKNYWSSSKVKNKRMEEIKYYLQKKAKDAIGRKTNWLLVSLALAYVIYIFLRTMKK